MLKKSLLALAIIFTAAVANSGEMYQASLTTATKQVTGPFKVNIKLNTKNFNLAEKHISVLNGEVISVEKAGKGFIAWITPYQQGNVVVHMETPIPPKARKPKNWDQEDIIESSEFLTVAYNVNNIPSVELYGANNYSEREFDVAVTFSEPVSGLASDQFKIKNGIATKLVGEGRYYHLTVQTAEIGKVSISLPQGMATDQDGDKQSNIASNVFMTDVSFSNQPSWIISTEEDWNKYKAKSSQLAVKDGQLHPTGQFSFFSSDFFKSQDTLEPEKLVLEQSSVWDNWQPAGDVGPEEAGNALVFVPVADNNYFILGAHPKARNRYDAWHSTDMKNWQHKGAVTPDGAKWVTTAEYVNGQFYIYYDNPNDEDPALIIDNDLGDGIPGLNVGTVFKEPSHGSDISAFYDDADNRVHFIYEDWTPVSAASHGYDSPLGGHSSSRNGIHDFSAHMHQPPVDLRTEETSEYGTYFHGTTRLSRIYQKHKGHQKAFGDWTTIKIGKQYYLFGDYHSTNEKGKRQPMQTARFTSDSLYKEFKLVGSLGEGHPDPSVGFAEGQFYLITQTEQDFVSPGPWVDGVSVRAGVDIDGDSSIDSWTDWAEIKESYDHKDGYIRVIEKKTAQLDLSKLPAGKQFKFEIKIDNGKVKDVAPIITAAKMTFKAN